MKKTIFKLSECVCVCVLNSGTEQNTDFIADWEIPISI